MVDEIVILNRILGNKSNSCSLKNITDEDFLLLIKKKLSDKEYNAIMNEDHSVYESMGYRKLREPCFINEIKKYFI